MNTTEAPFDAPMIAYHVTRMRPGIEAERGLRLKGYAAVFNQATNLGAFMERIDPDAFRFTQLHDVRFMVNHAGLPMGRTTAGTLQLGIDNVGLHYTVQLPDTEAGRELHRAVERGDVTGSSFGFTIEGEVWNVAEGLRTITSVGQVFEVSAVAFPAYEGTSVQVA